MDILFVVMPFADAERPSLGISLLAAAAERRGYTAAVRYFSLDLVKRIGASLYTFIAHRGDPQGRFDIRVAESLLGERCFAEAAFPGAVPDLDAWIERFLPASPMAPAYRAAARDAPAFADLCAAEITRLNPRVVAFTTSFDQTVASLAVARRLPAPRPLILFGGANCEGDMGMALLDAFPEIDAVCTGEGDHVIGPFLDRALRGQGPPVAGIVERGQPLTTPPRAHDLDALPTPDFSGYFAQARDTPGLAPRLVIETSRGCWWGQKHHCTFCGLNAGGMIYRSKSPERVIGEIMDLSRRWSVSRVDAMDNILDPRHITRVFPELSRQNAGLELFYETKANLRYDDLVTLRAGGVRAIQPGIESLDTEVLAHMKKGTTAATNVRLLVWCSELGFDVAWGILFGFPGEPAAAYARMADLIPRLVHLPPPSFVGPVRLDRWSPLFNAARGAKPKPAYGWTYPLPPDTIHRLAYFFDPEEPPDTSHTTALARAADAWIDAASSADPPRLEAVAAGPMALVRDTRPCAARPTHILEGDALRVFAACDRGSSTASIAQSLDLPREIARDHLQRLSDLGLVVELDGRFLALAVWRRRPTIAVAPPASPRTRSLPILPGQEKDGA